MARARSISLHNTAMGLLNCTYNIGGCPLPFWCLHSLEPHPRACCRCSARRVILCGGGSAYLIETGGGGMLKAKFHRQNPTSNGGMKVCQAAAGRPCAYNARC